MDVATLQERLSGYVLGSPDNAIRESYALRERGKDFQACWVYLEETKVRFKPRYGSGKCQHLVPCETGIPGR